ncbi:MAG: formate dehydrogenase [Desulfobacter sp.]|nr:formate dehydrogenase [Desulfobacter sp.]
MIASIEPSKKGMEADLKTLMKTMMEKKIVDALVLPVRQPDKISVMPSLIASPEEIDDAVFLSPCFYINAARMVSRLSFKKAGKKTAVWLRPCEISAFIELEKLNQASWEELIIMGMDCPMALERDAFQTYMKNGGAKENDWAARVFADPCNPDLAPARSCSVCTSPLPDHADLGFFFYANSGEKGLVIEGATPKGEEVLEKCALKEASLPGEREPMVAQLIKTREAAFESMAEKVTQETDSLDKLGQFFGACINCYNCCNVCPVCYCRECVFNTDVFSHEPIQYHQWADKWGKIKLPSDTLFYHLTRLAHMSHACVGCGQCTQACPANIPVATLFSTVAKQVQKAFDYHPGSDDPPPFSVFNAQEYPEVVGIQ